MASRSHHSSVRGNAHAARRVAVVTHKMHGQQTIDTDRVTQIQTALIRQNYMTGDPSGHWDTDTQAAMTKFQGDQGWQTRLTPDSRALIKLGLGPNHAGAINAADSANFNTLSSPKNSSVSTPGLMAASGVSR